MAVAGRKTTKQMRPELTSFSHTTTRTPKLSSVITQKPIKSYFCISSSYWSLLLLLSILTSICRLSSKPILQPAKSNINRRKYLPLVCSTWRYLSYLLSALLFFWSFHIGIGKEWKWWMRKIVVRVIDNKLIELFGKFLSLKGGSFIKKVRNDKIESHKTPTVLRMRFLFLRQATTLDNRLEYKKSPKCTPSYTGQIPH